MQVAPAALNGVAVLIDQWLFYRGAAVL